MSLETLVNRTCKIVRRLPSDDYDKYGREIPLEDIVDTVCELQQQRRDEPDDQGELSDTRWNLFVKPGTDLRTGDAVIVDGEEYEMVGDPWTARNPRTKAVSHLECTLRRTAASDDEAAGS